MSLLRRQRLLQGASLVGLITALELVHACDVNGDPIVGGPGGGAGADGAGGSAGSGNDCGPDGTPCSSGVCTGGVCCPTSRACGAVCCPDEERCSFNRCVPPGSACIDDEDCLDGQICDHDLDEPPGDGGEGGATCPTPLTRRGRCVDPPPPCNPETPPTAEAPLTCLTECEHRPESIGSADLRWSWGDRAAPGNEESVITTPLVIPLDDDDCSGSVDQGDIPEIVIVSFANGNVTGNGRLRVLSTETGSLEELWSIQPAESPIAPHRPPAAGDIDGEPGNEIVVCTVDDRVRAFDASGGELWTSEPGTGCAMPSLADLDRDGTVEVVASAQVLDGATGAVEATLVPANTLPVVVGDIDGDGDLDLIAPGRAYHGDGTLLVDTGLTGTHPALADLDGDGRPEAIVADRTSHQLRVWRWTTGSPGFAVVRAGIDLHASLPASCASGTVGESEGGGPPVVADFDGDAVPDVGVAAGLGYVVLDGASLMNPAVADADTVRWARPNQDCTSAETGSSAFDFDGDGRAEVVYADELTLGVFDGVSGEPVLSSCVTNRTMIDYPVVADVDGDTVADLVAIANSHSALSCDGTGKSAGVRVFGSPDGGWARTRGIWNQHAHHITNVLPDGRIPEVQAPAVEGFRRSHSRGFGAPDLIASVTSRCMPTYALVARVLNVGRALAPPGVPIGFYAGHPDDGGRQLGTAATTRRLYPGESENVELEIGSPPPDLEDGDVAVHVVVDDGAPAHAWRECRVANNVSPAGTGDCSGPPQ